jgi:uroporphyrinogen-III decarboxylase
MLSACCQRVLQACAFERPDQIPCFDSFWEFPATWRERWGDPSALSDVAIWYPDETPFPSRARRLKEEAGYIYEIDSWGRTVRRRADAFFVETLDVAIPEGTDPAAIEFDPPELESRYLTGKADPSVTFASAEQMREALAFDKQRHCVFGKTGGPYLRSCYLRGEAQFLIDMAADPALARAVAEKITHHMIRVGVEEIRRWDLAGTGMWIYDDMASNRGPMFGPQRFEQVLLPCYREMIRAYRAAGARYVFLHSDGDIRPLLEMLADAGIDGLNPLERRAGMDIAVIRKRFPRLILTGGMCNTHTLIKGTKTEIEAEAREIIDLGRNGGVVIGTHSISPEIPLENYAVYRDVCQSYGRFV